MRKDSTSFLGLKWLVAMAITLASSQATLANETRVIIREGRWMLGDSAINSGTPAEGLLMNVRMVNCTFEDLGRIDFDPEANTNQFIAKIPEYKSQGVNAFTLCLQGGMPGYEGAINSAFTANGELRTEYVRRVERVIRACDQQGLAVILGCFYQRQDQQFQDEAAIRTALVAVVRWIQKCQFTNVVLEVTNEYGHGGFDFQIFKTTEGQIELIRLAKKTHPQLLVSTSGGGGGGVDEGVARVCDFLLVHYNNTPLPKIPDRIAALQKFGKPIVCNEDDKVGADGARALELSVRNGASWGFMHEKQNQRFPFEFAGEQDDPVVYGKLKELTTKSVP
ncbi:MAG: hypothetical protein KDA87_02360 [Planctomycetales bacterium]|nr:hypothetical protein [Planctomycetales bacterium]